MEIKRSGSQPSGKGPTDYFTGTVRIDPLFEAPEPARVRGASVTLGMVIIHMRANRNGVVSKTCDIPRAAYGILALLVAVVRRRKSRRKM